MLGSTPNWNHWIRNERYFPTIANSPAYAQVQPRGPLQSLWLENVAKFAIPPKTLCILWCALADGLLNKSKHVKNENDAFERLNRTVPSRFTNVRISMI